jgi:hypothetical protein
MSDSGRDEHDDDDVADGDAASEDASEASAPEAPAKPAAKPKPAFFHKWMRLALLVAIGTGVPAGLWCYQYTTRWNHKPPKVDLCFQGLTPRLKDPVVVSASEPYLDRASGETIYLTDTQYRAVQCAEILPEGAATKLARAFSKEKPEAQAEALAEVVTSAGEGEAGEKQAVGMWMLASPAVEALPRSDARVAAQQKMDEFVGCRFDHPRLPGCASRPAFPVGIWLLGGAGAFALALVLASMLQTAIGRVALRFAKPSEKKGSSSK